MREPVVIICVDDEPTVLESLKIELKRALGNQCMVETAEGGEEALELLDELRQDDYEVALVVADYIMPRMKGDELLQQIHDRSPKTLNIMLSGQADLQGVSNAIRRAKLYRFISKPWQSEDFNLTVTEAIQSYLQERQLEWQRQQLEQANQELAALYQQVQALNTTLEQQVEERTAQLQQRIQEVEDLSKLKEYFLYAVSHDMRTPVMGMLLALKNFQETTTDSLCLSRSILDRMVQSCERQLQLLDSLLEIHSGDVRGVDLKRETINFGELIQAIGQDLEPIVQNNQGTLVNQIPLDLPTIDADPMQLRRVFENLVTNSVKHNPPGIQVTLNASVMTDRTPVVLQCIIQDNGVGMTAEECESMFSRYARGTRNRRSVGVGLGLYLCQQIIEAHGGQITVTSAPGEGAKFSLTLPLGVA